MCTGPGKCLMCTHTVLDPVKQTCLPCSVPNCEVWQALGTGCAKEKELHAPTTHVLSASCWQLATGVFATCRPLCLLCSTQTVDKCEECITGFRLDERTSTCLPCGVTKCYQCYDNDQCARCMPGYGTATDGAACHKCTFVDPNCLSW